MKLLSFLYRQSKPLLLFSTTTGILSGLSGAALVAVIGKGLSLSLSLNVDHQQLSRYAALFFVLVVIHLLTKSASEISLLRLTQAAICSLRIALSRKVLAAPQKRLQALGKSELLVILTKDVDAFTQSFVSLPIAFGNLIIISTCLIYMVWLSWQVFLVIVLFGVLGTLSFTVAERGPLRLLERVREQMNTLYQHFRDLIEGSRELQLNRTRAHLFINKVLANEAWMYRKNVITSMKGYAIVVNFATVLFYVLIGTVLFVVPQWMGTGWIGTTPSIELMSTLALILLYLVRPVSELAVAIPVVRGAEIALHRIQQLDRDLEEGQSLVATKPVRHHVVVRQGWNIALTGIRHHYPSSSDDSQFVLGPLDFSIQQGEILYIVGGNGSGKTTLAMLILGLYRPDEGSITVNGHPVTEENIDTYRQNFSAVFADFHLFEHLLEPDPDQTTLSSRAQHYIDALGMTHKVKVVDGRFSTLGLSTGQRKRLALVSAYLEDRPIYLFDEWAADQDPAFKRVFYTELLPELKSRGKTAIVITHDDAYFSYADRVIKLEDGHRGRDYGQK